MGLLAFIRRISSLFNKAADPSGKLGRASSRAEPLSKMLNPHQIWGVKYFCSNDPQSAFLLAEGAPSWRANNLGLCKSRGISRIIVWGVSFFNSQLCMHMRMTLAIFSSSLFVYFVWCLDNMDFTHIVKILWTWLLTPYLERFEVMWSGRRRPAAPSTAFTIYIAVPKKEIVCNTQRPDLQWSCSKLETLYWNDYEGTDN